MKSLIQQGYSLIELMIAVLLGSILLLGATQVMISSSTLGTTTSNLLANQDTAKSALDLLGSEARRAGYNGCVKATDGLLDIATYPDKDRYALMPVIEDDGKKVGIEFRYGIDENTGGKTGDLLSSKDCLNKPLYYRTMIYKNCTKDNKEGICITGGVKQNDKSLADDIIENVTLTKIVFTYFNLTDNEYQTITFPGQYKGTNDVLKATLKDLQTADSVTFYIKVLGLETGGNKTKSMTRVEREYSASYKLRNL